MSVSSSQSRCNYTIIAHEYHTFKEILKKFHSQIQADEILYHSPHFSACSSPELCLLPARCPFLGLHLTGTGHSHWLQIDRRDSRQLVLQPDMNTKIRGCTNWPFCEFYKRIIPNAVHLSDITFLHLKNVKCKAVEWKKKTLQHLEMCCLKVELK